MRPMAETFFLGRTPERPRPQKAGWVPQQPTYFFFSLGSVAVVAFVPQLGEGKKKGQGGRGSGGRESINNVRQI